MAIATLAVFSSALETILDAAAGAAVVAAGAARFVGAVVGVVSCAAATRSFLVLLAVVAVVVCATPTSTLTTSYETPTPTAVTLAPFAARVTAVGVYVNRATCAAFCADAGLALPCATSARDSARLGGALAAGGAVKPKVVKVAHGVLA